MRWNRASSRKRCQSTLEAERSELASLPRKEQAQHSTASLNSDDPVTAAPLVATESYLPEATDKANKRVMLGSVKPMTSSSSLGRLRRLDGRQKRLLLRAAALLGVASAAVALLPFRVAVRFGSGRFGSGRASPDECVWAVEAASRRLPWRTVCIEKGLVVQRMLRSGGFDAVLHYGARNHPESGKLEAHVWVSVDGRPIIGGREAADFAPIATYP
jgi:hypothetical protein